MPNFGTTPTSTTTLGTNQFPVSAAWVPNSGTQGNLTAVEGIAINTDSNGFQSTAIRLGLKDGDDATQGLTTDAAVTGDVAGTISAKLRGLNKIFAQLQFDGSNFLKVNVSAGTVAATQSGAWNIGNITGTISLPTGAAQDATVAKLNIAQSTALGSSTGPMVQASVTASAPTYTTGNINPLSLTTAGALRVDASATTQPVSGTFWQATQPISAASLPLPSGAATSAKQPALGTAGTASSDVITVQGIASMTPLAVSGTFWQATQPVSGTITANQGGSWTVTANAGTGTFNNQQSNITADYDTSAGTQNLTMYGLALPASGGAVAGGTSSNPVRIDPTGTTTQPVSGTVTVQQSTASNLKVDLSGTAANATAIKVDGSAVTQPVSGTITANIGTTNGLALDTSVNGILLSQGSTTSGQKGPILQAAVTTAAPSYTTAQTSPLSLTTAGALRVDNSAVTQPVSGTVTVQQSTASNLKVDLSGTAANSTAIKVDGSAVTQPVSGTVTANAGSGTFTVSDQHSNITTDYDTGAGTQTMTMYGLALPASGGSVAGGTSSNPVRIDPTGTTTQPVSGTITANIGTSGSLALDTSVNGILLAQASTTSGQKGPLIQGAVTTNAPTYTTAQTSPFSLDTSGLLRVSLKDTPANTNNLNVALAASSATVTVSASGNFNNASVGSTGSAVPASASYVGGNKGGNLTGLSLDGSGNLNVNVAAGSSGNAAAAATGSAVPASADYTGINVAGTLRGQTGVNPSGTIYAGQIDLSSIAGTTADTNSGNKSAGTLRVVLATDQPALTNALSVAQSGTWTVQPGNVQNSTAWLTQDAADGPVSAGAAASKSILVGLVYNSSAPAPTSGQQIAKQADQAGNLRTVQGIASATLSAWNNGTSLNTTQNIFTNSGVPAVAVQLDQTSTLTAGAITFEVSYDGTNWGTIPSFDVLDPTSTTYAQISVPYTLQASTNKAFLLINSGWQGLRIKLSTAITGTGAVTPYYSLLPYNPAATMIALSPTAANFNVSAVQSGAWTVTANAGTNLNTSALALESGGNLATLAGAVSSAKMQANVAQINGVAPSMGNGVSGTGVQRVTIASDSTGQVTLAAGAAVTANIGTTNGLALDTSVNGLLVSQGSTTSGEKGPMVQAAVTTNAPSYTTAQTSPLSLDTSGLLRVSLKDTPANTNNLNVNLAASAATVTISGTITANAGTNLNTSALALDTSVNGLLLSQGSTTSGQKGPLHLAAVTTNTPSYTTAQSSPLSLDTSGLLRVSLKDTPSNTNNFNVNLAASAATVTVSGTVTANIGTSGSLALDATVAKLNVAQAAALGSNTGPMVQGSVTTSAPTYTTGNINPLSLTTAGALRVDASATTQPISGTVTANAGTGNFTVVQATGSNLHAVLDTGSSIVGKVGIDQTTIGTTNAMTIVNNNTGSATSAEVTATKRLRVQIDSTQVFYEAWDSGTVDTTYNWNAAVTGGNGSSTPSAGQEILSSGTTANGYAYLTSKIKHQPVSPGYLQFDHQVQFTYPLPAHTYAYWGAGTVPGAPTSSAPLTDAVAFELATNGKMSAVCYAGGTRNSIQDLSSSTGNSTQPTDANVHKYEIYMRGDNIYWLIDNQSVASISTGALGPNTNLLPIMLLSGTDATGASSAQQLTSAAVYVGDTSKAFAHISDPTHPQYAVAVKPGSTAAVATDPSLVVGFSPNSPLPAGASTIGAVTQASGPWTINTTQINSAAIATVASGTQKVGVVGNTGATFDSIVGAGTAPTNAIAVSGLYNSTAPAPTTGQAMALQLDQAGNMRLFPGIALAALSAWNSGTALNTTQNIFTNSGAEAVLVQLTQTTTLTAGAITFEVSYDGSTWGTIPANCVLDPTSTTFAQISLPYTVQASTNKQFLLNMNGAQGLRIKLSTQITGTGAVTPNYALLPASPADTVIALSPTAANFNVTAVQSGTWTQNITQISGSSVATAATGIMKVGVADGSGNSINSTSNALNVSVQNSTLAVTQSGTWTAVPNAATSGGSTASHTMSTASTNATSLKASAGQVYGLSISNANASARYFKLYNKASSPTVGTDTPILTLQIPGNGTVIRAYPVGLVLGTGIAWACTGGIADSDTTAIGANDCSIDIDYK